MCAGVTMKKREDSESNREKRKPTVCSVQVKGETKKTEKRPTVKSTAKYPDERSETFYRIWQLDDSHWRL